MRFVQSAAHVCSSAALYLCVLAISFTPPAAAKASTLYTITDLGSFTTTLAINNQGTVLIGNSLYSNGQVQVLPQPTGGVFKATAFNDLGQVAGYVNLAGGYNFDLALYSQGKLTVMPTLSGLYPTAINNNGQISGDSVFAYQVFLNSNGSLTAINPSPGGVSASRGMNNAGNVIGITTPKGGAQQGFLYSTGQITLIPTPGLQSQVSAINDSGQIVGTYEYSQSFLDGHIFLSGGGTFRDLGLVLNMPSEIDSAHAINDSGVIVGNAEIPTGLNAWVYSPGSGFTNLNALISPASGWQLQSAGGINNDGQIVGYGMHNGQFEDFLLTPVPEPRALALFGVGLLAAGILKFRTISQSMNCNQRSR